MSRRRLAAAVFFSAVIVLVLALIVYTERSNATQTVSVWIVTHEVLAGAPYTVGDVQRVQIRARSGDFNYETLSPGAFHARFARTLSANDILRADDLVSDSSEAEVALTVVNPPPLSEGAGVDIFAGLPDGQQVRIGRDLIIQTVSGGSVTVLVPVADEASWIAIGSSNVALHVARTLGGAQIAPPPQTADDAVRILCGAPCADLAANSTLTP